MQSGKKRDHFNKIYTVDNEAEGATRGVLEKNCSEHLHQSPF